MLSKSLLYLLSAASLQVATASPLEASLMARDAEPEGETIGTFDFSVMDIMDGQPLEIIWADEADAAATTENNLAKRSKISESVCTHAGTATGANLHWLEGICTGKTTYVVNCAPATNKNAGSSHPGTCPAGQDCFQLEQVGNFWGDRKPDITCVPSGTLFDGADTKEATHVNGRVVTRAGTPSLKAPKLLRLKAQVYARDGHYGSTSAMGFYVGNQEAFVAKNVASMGPTWNFRAGEAFKFFFTPGPNAFRIQGTINVA